MMSNGPVSPETAPVPLDAVYTEALRTHALALIALGYARMMPAFFASAQEDAITGELTREMRAAMETDTSPEWTQHYSVAEQVRANTPNLQGTARPIVDIEFERVRHGRRPRLRFEAKRLGPHHSAGNYFGDGGLEAFVTGYYDRTHSDAGMLGYVQSENELIWAGKLAPACVERTRSLSVTAPWAEFSADGSPPHTYRTSHQDHAGQPLHIFHVLLGFAG